MHGVPSRTRVSRPQQFLGRGWLRTVVSPLVLHLVAAGGILSCGGGGGGPPAPIIPAIVAPSIVTQPAVVTVTVGQPAIFSVSAAGTAPLTYQWQRAGADIAGATATTYPLSTTVLADNGASFRVVVKNSAGTLVSDAATLTVNALPVAPSITAQPSSVRVFAPAVVTFTANFTGIPFPTAQWQLSTDNGVTWANIAGATMAVYTTPATTFVDNLNQFRIVATNIAGVATSVGAVLTVNATLTVDKLVVFAGNAGAAGNVDAIGAAARFKQPYGIARDPATGNVYVSEIGSSVIRKITAAGVVTTLAGLAGSEGSVDGTGSGARFLQPHGLAVDAGGNVIVADYGNHLIRRITPAGVVTTIAGKVGVAGTLKDDVLFFPTAVAVDASGRIYVANSWDNTIAVINGSSLSRVAGFSGRPGKTDGVDSLALFNRPSDLVLDGRGNLFVVDGGNHTIRRIVLASQQVTTYAGTPGIGGTADGIGTAAGFADPTGIVIDAAGTLYVSDTYNNVIRKITIGAVVTTVLGQLRSDPGFEFRTGPDPRLGGPVYMAMIDATHIVMAMRSFNHAVYVGTVP